MTCIAWDGRYIVADGLTTFCDQISDEATRKLHRVVHPIYGPMIAGLAGCVPYFAKWLKAIEREGFDAEISDMDSGQGIFVNRAGECWEAQANGTWERIRRHCATGSGAMLAYPILRDGGHRARCCKIRLSPFDYLWRCHQGL